MPSEKSRFVSKKFPRSSVNEKDSNEKKILFNSLKKGSKSELIKIIDSAYEAMTFEQRENIFGDRIRKIVVESLNGKDLISKINSFIIDSKNGKYYSPFKINSKNFSHVPEETKKWFSCVGDFLTYASQLAKKRDYKNSVVAFKLIYELIDLMESGDDIVFAEELGTWMLPVDETKCMYYYIISLCKEYGDQEFSNEIIPLLKRDSIQSFSLKVYETAMKFANKEQLKHLNAEIKREKIRLE